MQTNFTADQLRDPETARSNEILRNCVHCGLCTATCPTFLLLGNELDSPRGRIYLIKDLLESGRPATEEVVTHVDRCLSCLSCMTTCPSGVHYMHLVDHARHYIEDTYQRPWDDRLLRGLLTRVLPSRRRFRAALRMAKIGALFAKPMPGRLGKRLRAMSKLAPVKLPAQNGPTSGIFPAEGTMRGRVALLTGCAQAVLAPAINEATIRLLNRLGIEVVVAPTAECCGALTHHMGYHDAAMRSAQSTIAAWSKELKSEGGEGLDAILVNTSGCGTTVKDYGHMFRAEAEPWRSRAAQISALARDISEYLVQIEYAPTRTAPGLTVAYHAACSLQHGQRVLTAPKQLLAQAGFRVTEAAESHICCGSAGTYNLLQPDIAAQLRARKLTNIRNTEPDLVAAGNIGCITQLSGGGLPVVHTVELLDWMAGGPQPAALSKTN